MGKCAGTLLIVDDLPANLSVLSEYLTEKGFKVLVANDGESGIEKAQYANPDLILLDVMMPGISGFDACEKLKSLEKTKNIPIIFMTSLSDTPYTIKAFELGAVDYVTKPIVQEEVFVRVRAQIQLCHLQRDLQLKNLELEAFSRTVAHDLKTPLSHIIGYSEELLDTLESQLDERSCQFLNSIFKAGNRMTKIINELLMLARTTKEDVETSVLDMHLIVTQAIQRTQRDCEVNGCAIEVAKDWPEVVGYASWVEQIWVNYLSNALKYGGDPPHISVGFDKLQDSYKFWVRDNGQGMDKAQCAKIFTPFTRLQQNQAEGHGLGLSIVQSITEKLNGEVGVESVVGQGSVFYFTLPMLEEDIA